MTNRHVTAEYDVTEHINAKGLRGPEFAYAKNPGEKRILILGDSFAEGYSVAFDSLFSEVLRRTMVSHGCEGATVINAGTGGYATDQEYLYFVHEGFRYHPDLTILLVYSNDITDNVQDRHWRGFKPYFKLENGKLTLANVPVPRPVATEEEHSDTDEGFFCAAKVWLNDNSRLYALVREFIVNNHRVHALAMKLGLAERPSGEGPLIRVPDELKVWRKSYDPQTKRAWEMTGALIRALKEVSIQANSDLLIFYVPVSASVHKDEWEATKKKYGLSDDEWSIDQVALELKALCNSAGLDFIDPTARFVSEAEVLSQQDRLLYFPLDRHWTPEGHRLSGELLFDYLYTNYRPWFKSPVSARR
ncbi:MAG: SGNH/GDSL hydrolase family protein [Candidatus Zixiibacteriota bacterium]|nr:MAG: SGNH/GDSL hydrolase family protein [candidate division Zixibacteria bacterium]